jgi:hypothetical protein
MTTQAWIVMTVAQANAAVALNGGGIGVDPRTIDNPLAINILGIPLNLSPLTGKKVVPARLLNDPDYARWVPTLGTYPIILMDSDVIFLPPSGV